VGFGAWAIGGGDWAFGWGPQDDADSIAAIRHALGKGINWIDTAAVYGLGHSEEVVARALRGMPGNERPYVFTKCGLVWDEKDRAAMAALALSADSLLLTAAANDLGYEAIFSRQIAALGRRGDVAVGLSTSGRSPNVLSALREARERGLKTTGFIGGNGGPMRELCDAAIIVPSAVTARIQEMHLLVTHMLCKALEASL
jgi:aryl-alcohol dehydrogenase-like predicted oxidoreductase